MSKILDGFKKAIKTGESFVSFMHEMEAEQKDSIAKMSNVDQKFYAENTADVYAAIKRGDYAAAEKHALATKKKLTKIVKTNAKAKKE